MDKYVASAQRQLEAEFDSFNGIYSEVRIEAAPPNGVHYVYVYSEFVDGSEAVEHLSSQAPVFQAAFDTVVAPEMEAFGFEDPTATYTYFNADGSRIWTQTFTQS